MICETTRMWRAANTTRCGGCVLTQPPCLASNQPANGFHSLQQQTCSAGFQVGHAADSGSTKPRGQDRGTAAAAERSPRARANVRHGMPHMCRAASPTAVRIARLGGHAANDGGLLRFSCPSAFIGSQSFFVGRITVFIQDVCVASAIEL